MIYRDISERLLVVFRRWSRGGCSWPETGASSQQPVRPHRNSISQGISDRSILFTDSDLFANQPELSSRIQASETMWRDAIGMPASLFGAFVVPRLWNTQYVSSSPSHHDSQGRIR